MTMYRRLWDLGLALLPELSWVCGGGTCMLVFRAKQEEWAFGRLRILACDDTLLLCNL